MPDFQRHRLSEYSTTKTCTIFVGTWNLMGRVCMYAWPSDLSLTFAPHIWHSHHQNHFFPGSFQEKVRDTFELFMLMLNMGLQRFLSRTWLHSVLHRTNGRY